jgi:hypothetical protein
MKRKPDPPLQTTSTIPSTEQTTIVNHQTQLLIQTHAGPNVPYGLCGLPLQNRSPSSILDRIALGERRGVTMSSHDGRQVSGGPKRRKRIITDARKEQNRIAQQLYRKLDSTSPLGHDDTVVELVPVVDPTS